jgi:hypothetical protein
MSSESNGRQPDAETGPASNTSARQSARAPSAWGATRDALAAVHNLEALLRSMNVLYRTIQSLLPELRISAAVLRETFDGARLADMEAGSARREVSEYGASRAEALVHLLDATATADDERDDLAQRAGILADELEASADLLALLERAAAPVPTDVNADLLARETVRLSGPGRGRELIVQFAEVSPDCLLYVDPYVVGPLLSLLVAFVHDGGVEDIVVRARCEEDHATFTIEPALPEAATYPTLPMRVLPVVPPATSAARRVATQVGATLELGDGRGSLRIPRSPG